MNTSNSDKKGNLMEKVEKLKSWFAKNAKIVMPVILAVCVIITVVISVSANKREVEQEDGVEVNNIVAGEENGGESESIQEIVLKENDIPEIKELIENYYAAQVTGDIDTIRTLVDVLDDSEADRIEVISEYLEDFPTLDIYTKPGPVENTYVVYISMTEKFKGYEYPIPGMMTHYVCVDDSGRYYISYFGLESERKYIEVANLQDDVIDLNNKINVEYNNMVAEDEELKQFLADLGDEIEEKVGEMQATAKENDVSENDEEDSESAGEDSPQTVTVVTKVKAIDVVNIRSSDSETADKLGKAAIGDEFKLIEKIGNGWSKIEYEGQNAYIKSMYLEDVEVVEVDSDSETPADTQVGSDAVTGTIKATANVRIRSEASETSEKLGLAYKGQKLDLIEHLDNGWTKIRYNGHVAYVKSDYVE